ncbi:cyanophycinase [Arsukibacterium sp.]|uniref:cyanophycinase n=1 Tax=Arsukibacterium sp. TaxID=1977258 RepID=UPI00299DFC0B|nr:cyanophycinase [Arsukibacterium sp.]MDX1539453.1 cyanophycinase [Arsukibacterium sp.]
MKKITACLSAILVAMPVFTLSANDENKSMPEYSMLLMGGGLATCSSTSTRHCSNEDVFSAAAKKHSLFQLSAEHLQAINSSGFWSEDRIIEQQQTLAVLEFLRGQLGSEPVSERELLRLWRGAEIEVDGIWVSGRNVYAGLSSRELNFVLDQLEVPVMVSNDANRSNQRSREYADLANTKNNFTVELYQKFVAMAQQIAGDKRKPRILVVTASSRDPFAAVDFYTNLFAETGADVSWLPISAAYQAAWQGGDKNSCAELDKHLAEQHGSYQRQRVYPDLMAQKLDFCQAGIKASLAQIRRADGIFFNGGDQSLTLRALRLADGSASAELQQIERMLEAGQIVVAGTSAGTAVMSGGSYNGQRTPMITNGDSYSAMQFGAFDLPAPAVGCDKDQSCSNGLAENHLTYSGTGGLGLFRWGVLDTHFSERGRQGRLIRLLHDTQSRYGFGIDENTGLLVGFGQAAEVPAVKMAVLGEAGVYVVDMNSANSSGEGSALTLRNVVTHYLTRSDEMELNANQLRSRFANWKFAPNNLAQPLLTSGDIFERDNYKQLSHLLCMTQARQAEGRAVKVGQGSAVTIYKDHSSYTRQGTFRQQGEELAYCSYRNIMVDLQPAN